MFKIGDRVRILPSAREYHVKDEYIGKEAEITYEYDNGYFAVKEIVGGRFMEVRPTDIELVVYTQQPEQGNADEFKYEGTQHRPYGLEIIEFIPREKWLDNRLSDVKRAIMMACQENFSIPQAWLDEYNELVRGK